MIRLAAAAAAGLSAVAALSAVDAAQSAPRAGQAAAATTPASSEERPRSVWDGVYTEEQAKRGEGVYRDHCLSCHGPTLTGREMAGPLVGATFTANWNGVTVGDLFERTRVSMPNDRPGTLSRQQIADVLAYVFSANKFPAGKTELARQPELLKQIRFDATKPAR
jgi:mono/diheme cytochrome c family protein